MEHIFKTHIGVNREVYVLNASVKYVLHLIDHENGQICAIASYRVMERLIQEKT